VFLFILKKNSSPANYIHLFQLPETQHEARSIAMANSMATRRIQNPYKAIRFNESGEGFQAPRNSEKQASIRGLIYISHQTSHS
jgi:hypothetical protein